MRQSAGRSGELERATGEVTVGPILRTIEVVALPITTAVHAALATVLDPEIRKPITELGMVESVEVAADGAVRGRRAAHRRRLPDEGRS